MFTDPSSGALYSAVYTNGSSAAIPGYPGYQTIAFAINNNGQTAGQAGIPDPSTGNPMYHAFLYTSGSPKITDLGTLGGTLSLANGVNDAGLVVGASTLTGDPVDASGNAIRPALLRPSAGGPSRCA